MAKQFVINPEIEGQSLEIIKSKTLFQVFSQVSPIHNV